MDNWFPIPGYEGVYWITKSGKVRNAKGHVLTPVGDETIGYRVELRNNGQRNRVFVSDLLAKTFGGM